MSMFHQLPPRATASSWACIASRTPVRTDHRQFSNIHCESPLTQREHSHFVLITLSCENVPSHGIFFHRPSIFTLMILLAMYTPVYTNAYYSSSLDACAISCSRRSSTHQHSKQIRRVESRMSISPHSWHFASWSIFPG